MDRRVLPAGHQALADERRPVGRLRGPDRLQQRTDRPSSRAARRQPPGSQAGDIITAVDGDQVDAESDLSTTSCRTSPATQITLTVIRGGSDDGRHRHAGDAARRSPDASAWRRERAPRPCRRPPPWGPSACAPGPRRRRPGRVASTASAMAPASASIRSKERSSTISRHDLEGGRVVDRVGQVVGGGRLREVACRTRSTSNGCGVTCSSGLTPWRPMKRMPRSVMRSLTGRHRTMPSATRTVRIIGSTSCTRTMSAPAAIASATVAAVPSSRSSGGAPPSSSPMNRLRLVPDQHRQPAQRRLQLRQPMEQLDGVFRRLAEADAGVDDQVLARDAARQGVVDGVGQPGDHLVEDAVGVLGHLLVVHQHQVRAGIGGGGHGGGVVPPGPDVVDDGRAGGQRLRAPPRP